MLNGVGDSDILHTAQRREREECNNPPSVQAKNLLLMHFSPVLSKPVYVTNWVAD